MQDIGSASIRHYLEHSTLLTSLLPGADCRPLPASAACSPALLGQLVQLLWPWASACRSAVACK